MQGLQNFAKEYAQLRRSFRFNEYKEISTANPPKDPLSKVVITAAFHSIIKSWIGYEIMNVPCQGGSHLIQIMQRTAGHSCQRPMQCIAEGTEFSPGFALHIACAEGNCFSGN